MKAAADGQAEDERWHLRKDGSRFWASGMMTALREPDHRLKGFAKVIRDNTERKQAQEALEALNRTLEARVAERTRQVDALGTDLVMAEQRERQRIALLLHDDLQQVLFGLQLRLESLRLLATAIGHAPLLAELHGVIAIADQASHVARNLAVDLVPPILRTEDLGTVLEWLALKMKEVHGLDVRLDLAGGVPLGEHHRILLFQVVRELLFNVVKHAGVQAARVSVQPGNGGLDVVVEDHGRGFDTAAPPARKARAESMGLDLIRDRMTLIGGRVEITSAPGGGTRVALHVPAG